MTEQTDKLLEHALSLPPAERAELAERLLSSLDAPSRTRIDELWAAEAEARLDAHERGETEAVPAKEVLDELRKKHRR